MEKYMVRVMRNGELALALTIVENDEMMMTLKVNELLKCTKCYWALVRTPEEVEYVITLNNPKF